MEQSPAAAVRKSLLVVAGSGRSGTSLFSGLAGRLGFYIPQPEVKANDSNPRGFGEPRWAVNFHKELLQHVDVRHDDGRPRAWEQSTRLPPRAKAHDRLSEWLSEQFEHSDRVVVKDPRLAWFVGLYAEVAAGLSADLCVVTMLRHPAETVRSKQLAYRSRIEDSTRMTGWLNMMLGVERATRELPRAVISYEELLQRWQPTLAGAEKAIPLDLVSGASDEQLADANALVDPSLRRTGNDWAELSLPKPLQDLAERTYQALSGMAFSAEGRSPDPSSAAELDEIREEFTTYFTDAEAVVKSSIKAAQSAERRRVLKEQQSPQRKSPGGRQRKRAPQQDAEAQRSARSQQATAAPPQRTFARRAMSGLRRRVVGSRSDA